MFSLHPPASATVTIKVSACKPVNVAAVPIVVPRFPVFSHLNVCGNVPPTALIVAAPVKLPAQSTFR